MQNKKLLDLLDYGVSPLLKSPHKWARDLYKKSAANNWTPLDSPSSEDIRQWSDPKGLTDDERHLVKRTLGQFSAGESLVSNAVTLIESKFITDGAIRDLLSRKAFEECLTKDHEVYTTDGWIDIDKVTVGHTVLGVRLHSTGCVRLQMNWELPTKVIDYPNYTGKLYSVGFKSHRYVCTSHHRCLTESKDIGKHSLQYAKDLISGNECLSHWNNMLENSGYSGDLDDFSDILTMLLQPLKTRYKEYNSFNKKAPVVFSTVEELDYFQLLAFSIGEKWVQDSPILSLKKITHTNIHSEVIEPTGPLQSPVGVYCLETPSGMFVARNKTSGLIFITGNSVHNWTAETCCEWFSLDVEEVAEAYKNIPSIAVKEQFIMKSMKQFDDMKNTTDPENIRAFIRNIFIIYMIVEGTWFISNFVALLSLKRRQKLPALGTQILYTWTDECNHVELGVNLLNILKEEYPGEYITEQEIYSLMDEALDIEKTYVEDLIPRGLPGLSSKSLKDHAEYIANINLMKLGLNPRYSIKQCPISWLEEVQGEKVSAFFEVRATNYVTTAELDDDL